MLLHFRPWIVRLRGLDACFPARPPRLGARHRSSTRSTGHRLARWIAAMAPRRPRAPLPLPLPRPRRRCRSPGFSREIGFTRARIRASLLPSRKKAGSWLLHHLVLNVFVVHAELVERSIQRLGDSAPGRLHPLHRVRLRLLGGTISPPCGPAGRSDLSAAFCACCCDAVVHLASYPIPYRLTTVDAYCPSGRGPGFTRRAAAARGGAFLGPILFAVGRRGLARVSIGRRGQLEQSPQTAGRARCVGRTVRALDLDDRGPAARIEARPGIVILRMISSCWPKRHVLLTKK